MQQFRGFLSKDGEVQGKMDLDLYVLLLLGLNSKY